MREERDVWYYKGMLVTRQDHPKLLRYSMYDPGKDESLIGVANTVKSVKEKINHYLNNIAANDLRPNTIMPRFTIKRCHEAKEGDWKFMGLECGKLIEIERIEGERETMWLLLKEPGRSVWAGKGGSRYEPTQFHVLFIKRVLGQSFYETVNALTINLGKRTLPPDFLKSYTQKVKA